MNSDYWDGEIDWYSPTEIGNKPYLTGSIKQITTKGFENCSAKLLPAGRTVLFTSRAGIGKMAILQKEGTTNQGFQSLVLKKDIDTYFLYSSGHLIKKYALSKASGSTFLEISGKTMSKMDIFIPSPLEQSKIGSFFEQLDKLIILYKNKLDKLSNIKEACFSKLFIPQE